jgi:hypothetical protein
VNAPRDFWGWLDAIEAQLPLTQAKLKPLVKVSFVKGVSFREAKGGDPGHVTLELAATDISAEAVAARLPGGHWVPPPPPGWGGSDAGPGYVVDRPWGQLWFGFGSGAGAAVRKLSFAPGAHGSPGV